MKTFDQILKDLKNKVYSPVYFLYGDEPYFIDQISDYIQDNVLDDTEKEFNLTVLYGLDVDVATIISNAKRYPMMANHQVVIIKEAQNIKSLKKLIDAKKDDKKLSPDIEAALNYLDKPLQSTILVFCYKYAKIDKRKYLSKLIDTKGVLFESEKIRDYKVAEWIQGYISSKSLKIEPNATQLLAEYLGNDLAKISNEVGKLVLNIPKETTITVKHIEDNIGISKDFNVFELQNAIARKDVFKANQIINYFKSNPKDNPIQLVLGNLYSYFTKVLILHSIANKSDQEKALALKVLPFFVKDYETAARNYSKAKLYKIFNHLRDYDMKSKGVDNISVDHGELLKEFIFKVMH